MICANIVPCFHHLHIICSNCFCNFKKLLILTWSIFITCSRWTPINKPLKSAICTRTLKTPLQLDNSACKQTPLWQVHQMYRLQWFLNFLCFTPLNSACLVKETTLMEFLKSLLTRAYLNRKLLCHC